MNICKLFKWWAHVLAARRECNCCGHLAAAYTHTHTHTHPCCVCVLKLKFKWICDTWMCGAIKICVAAVAAKLAANNVTTHTYSHPHTHPLGCNVISFKLHFLSQFFIFIFFCSCFFAYINFCCLLCSALWDKWCVLPVCVCVCFVCFAVISACPCQPTQSIRSLSCLYATTQANAAVYFKHTHTRTHMMVCMCVCTLLSLLNLPAT